MAIFTISPWVLLALILASLLIILLVAFNRQAAENILHFFEGLLVLYQRLRQILSRTARTTSEQDAKDAQQNRTPGTDQAPVAADTSYVLSTLQPQAALQQRPTAETMGE